MTRINSHQVIQMVGDDRLVFVDDWSGHEEVVPIADMPKVLGSWKPVADQGFAFGFDENTRFKPAEFPAVDQAVQYFIECSTVPLADQIAQLKIVDIESADSLGDLFEFLGGDADESKF
jgi:hypothetical protein